MNLKFVFYCSTISLFLILILMGQWAIPFIAGLTLAYCFHYPAKLLSQRLHCSTSISSGVILLGLLTIFSLITLFLIPLIRQASVVLFNKLFILINTANANSINEFFHNFLIKFGINKRFDIGSGIQSYFEHSFSNIPHYLLNFFNTGKSLIYILMFTFMIPIITFYLLRDWEKLSQAFMSLLHRFTSPSILNIVSQINRRLGDYIKGQLLTCGILSIIYVILLSLIGAKESLVCGIFSGLISIVPFFGPFFGAGITMAMGINEFVFTKYIFIICIYIFTTFLDSNFITPKLIGDKIGLSPVWLLFSISASMSLFGIIGSFVAVPLTVIFATALKVMLNKL